MLALVEHVAALNVVATVVDTGSSAVAAQWVTSFAKHKLLLVLDDGCRMAPAIRDLLLKQMSNCWGCSEGSPVCPFGVGFGMSELGSGWCSKLQHLDCSVRERSMRNEQAG